MTDPRPVTAATVRSLSEVASLPLSPERQAALLPSLAILIEAANALSARMAASDRAILPLLRFPER
jgi:hypothetical protein